MAPLKMVVVPCYNEAERLELPAFDALLAAGIGLIFVDDGSTDTTQTLLEGYTRSRPGAELIVQPENRGKGEAVRVGMRDGLERGASVVGYFDADQATPIAEMIRLIALTDTVSAQVVLASRVRLLGREIERQAIRHYTGRVFATAASLLLQLPVYDTQCGAKCFKRTPALQAALTAPFTSRWAFDVELLLRLTTDGGLREADLLEVPLQSWCDVGGSKLTTTAMARAAMDILRMSRGRLRRPQGS